MLIICITCFLLSPSSSTVSDETFSFRQMVNDHSECTECHKAMDASHVKQMTSLDDEELKRTSEALWNKHVSYFTDYLEINYQMKNTNGSEDLAPDRLLSVSEDIWKVPIVYAFQTLLDNYVRNTSIAEDVTVQEKSEEKHFLDLIMDTPVMVLLMDFLKNKGIIPQNRDEQMNLLSMIWFDLYPRQKKKKKNQKKLSSSGFEHTFLSEVRGGKVLGLHNWIYFHTMEVSKNVNYWGYIKKIDVNKNMALLKFSMDMEGKRKPVNSIFIGTSPEFEMAIYTLCFLTRADKKCPIHLNGNKLNIRTHSYNYNGKKLIGTAFPEL